MKGLVAYLKSDPTLEWESQDFNPFAAESKAHGILCCALFYSSNYADSEVALV